MRYPVWLGAAAAACSLAVTVAAPAVAEPTLYVVHYDDHDEQTFGNDDCVPFEVSFDYEIWGTFHVVTHGNSPYYGANNFNEIGVFTNSENGKTFSFVSHGVDKDVHVTDDGTGILTIHALEAGPVNYYGPDGTPLFHDAGLFRFTVVIDTNGTPTDPDDDEELSFTPTGYWGTEQSGGRDFCADLRRYLG